MAILCARRGEASGPVCSGEYVPIFVDASLYDIDPITGLRYSPFGIITDRDKNVAGRESFLQSYRSMAATISGGLQPTYLSGISDVDALDLEIPRVMSSDPVDVSIVRARQMSDADGERFGIGLGSLSVAHRQRK